jgi:hypothetical protein
MKDSCNMQGEEKKNGYKILVGKSEVKKPLEKTEHR